MTAHDRSIGVRTPFNRTFAMSGEWLSYSEAAERLYTTVEGVRLRALPRFRIKENEVPRWS
jgi:hypothetical protein